MILALCIVLFFIGRKAVRDVNNKQATSVEETGLLGKTLSFGDSAQKIANQVVGTYVDESIMQDMTVEQDLISRPVNIQDTESQG